MRKPIQSEIRELGRSDFPLLLKEIPDLPAKLFLRGRLPEYQTKKRKFLCVVGSRHHSQYGADVCESLIKGLRGTDIVIVSGLAIGIDGIAHRAALDAGLTTVAVLGSGLEWEAIYPRTNFNLAKEIIAAGGGLISEFSGNYRPHKFNFPQRNRIMAGLCHATLVIEAAMKSGTLITARLALDYNRDVFTVPGSIFSKQSEGPHMLLSNGAMVVRESADIVRGLGLREIPSEQANKNDRLMENCTELEKKVYRLLAEPLPRTEILQRIQKSGNDAREISVAISLLEMKGFITESGGILRIKIICSIT